MEISQKLCRLCLSQTEFSVSLFGTYCRRTNMVDKILVCLKLVIEDGDFPDAICYKCAENVERYHDFMMDIKKCQMRYCKENWREPRPRGRSPIQEDMRHHVTSYVREEVFDADYTFSFLEVPNDEKEKKVSSPVFSYFSPPNVVIDHCNKSAWKTPKSECVKNEARLKKKPYQAKKAPRHHSRDLFDSQSQDVDEAELKSFDWKLTPDDNIIKRIREKCFGRSDF